MRIVALMMLALFLLCAPAYADEDFSTENLHAVVKPGAENAGPSAGTLAAAALESAGYRAQHVILRDLKNLFSSGAGLIFLICAMVGIASIVLVGKYDMVLWMLIGPTLFAFVLTTTKASGAQWQWGNDPELKAAVESVTSADITQPSDVSQVFHWYNNLISSIYRSTITVLASKDHKELMKTLMSRQRIIDELYRDELKDGRLRGLIRYTHEKCSTYFNAARLVGLAVRDRSILATPAYANALETLKLKKEPSITGPGVSSVSVELYKKRSISDVATLQTLDELLQKEAPAAYQRRMANYDANADAVPAYTTCVREAQAKPDIATNGASCSDLICYIWIGAEAAANETLNDQKKQGYWDNDPELWREIREDITAKLTVPEDVEMAGDDPDTPLADPRDPNYKLPKAKLYERYRTDISAIPVIIGGTMIRKVLSSDGRSQLQSAYSNHSGVSLKSPTVAKNMTPEQEQSLIVSMRQHEMAAAKQWEIYTFAMTLPYLQGVLLYVLSVTFPFFALFLVVPGHAKTVFTWMTMWAWAKSWDVGWVFVATVDDILWGLMPNSSAIDPVRDPKNAPVQMLEMAFQGDPSYSLATYYMLISLMIVGVPVITAQIIMGGKNAVADLVVGGAKELASKMGGYGNDWVRHDFAMKTDTLREGAVRKHNRAALTTDASKQLDLLKGALATQGIREGTAGFRKEWARNYGIGGAALTAIGAGLVAKGKWGVFGYGILGAGLGGLNASKMTWKDYIQTKRRLSHNQTELMRLNASGYNSLARRNEEVLKWDRIRAGATLRGEFFNLPPEESGALKGVADFNARESAEDISEQARTKTIFWSQAAQGAVQVPAGVMKRP